MNSFGGGAMAPILYIWNIFSIFSSGLSRFSVQDNIVECYFFKVKGLWMKQNCTNKMIWKSAPRILRKS